MPFRIGGVLVESSRLRLSADGKVRDVEPRVMDVLTCLAGHRGDVVSRDALTAAVWGDVHVGYHALARAIHEARRALSELAPGVEMIETIPRRGYRVCVPIEEVAPSPGVEAPVSTPAGSAAMRLAAGLVPLGLAAHASGWHGTPAHLLAAAAVTAFALWPALAAPQPARSW